ncbi:Short-chain dehydrogenase/reductase family 42E member 1 [Bienertia sinuspersici]
MRNRREDLLVTGGSGFVGASLCLELLRRGAREVRSLDLRAASSSSSSLLLSSFFCLHHRMLSCIFNFFCISANSPAVIAGITCILRSAGDITCQKDVMKALKGADCVFHVASYGMSGKEMLQFGRIDEININGTCIILDACVDLGVKRLVYVSTYNVVFGGKEIINGDETLPYLPLDDHVDPYGRSKSIAEQLVLKYNGRPFREKNGGYLYTCAIRPAAIYGPGEERHLPRIMNNAKLGLLLFKVGDPTVKADWVYVDNLVLALILASMGLLNDIPGREGCPVAAGQSYFISDGYPVNTFEFLRPILKSLEYDVPNASLSLPSALMLGKMFWVIYTILYPWLNKSWIPQPLCLPTEVYKVGVTHYFSYLKAKKELGYFPMVSPKEGMEATISYWKDKKKRSLDGPTIYIWLFSVLGMFALIGVTLFPDFGPLAPVTALALYMFGSMRNIRLICSLAVGLHVSEGIYAWHLAKKVDPANARGWFWQTFALGIFSLRFLLKRAQDYS